MGVWHPYLSDEGIILRNAGSDVYVRYQEKVLHYANF